jgi:polyhydroxyalkanoate synthesis regulator phasin
MSSTAVTNAMKALQERVKLLEGKNSEMKAIIDENAARQRELEFHQQGTEYLREEIVKLRNDKE